MQPLLRAGQLWLLFVCAGCQLVLGDPFKGYEYAALDASTQVTEDRAQRDAVRDAGLDAGLDAGSDASFDAGFDAAADAPADNEDAGSAIEEPTVVSYHDRTASEHRERVAELAKKGYRPTVLSLAGEPPNTRYAAVWTRDSGPAWRAVDELTASAFDTRLAELKSEGFAPTLLTATGVLGNERFAAVFEQGADTQCNVGLVLYGTQSLVEANDAARADERIPRSLVMYGDPSNYRFAGIWEPNVDHVQWSWGLANARMFQRYSDQLTAANLRPSSLSSSVNGDMLSVFRGDHLERGSWQLQLGLSGGEHQRAVEQQAMSGRRPIVIASGGLEGRIAHATVFAETAAVAKRAQRVRGEAFASAQELDQVVGHFMATHGVRAGAVAVGRAGEVRLARGYTNAERERYPETTPDTRFRIAGVSAVFTAAEISALVSDGQLSWTTAAFPFAGVTSVRPDTAVVDPASDSATLQQLVLHKSGLARRLPSQRQVAALLGIEVAPLDPGAVLEYVRGLPQEPEGYSDPGIYLLTAVVERASGLSYLEALTRDVLAPLGIADVTVGSTSADRRQPGEVYGYDCGILEESQLDFAAEAVAPSAYGGGFVLENTTGATGLVTSAPSLVRLIAHYPVWSVDQYVPARRVDSFWSGLPGSTAGVVSRSDGLDFAFLFNLDLSNSARADIRDSINRQLDMLSAEL